MDSGMFGAPIGVSAFQRDAESALKTNLAAAHEMSNLAMMPDRQALLKAQVREHTLNADKTQLAIDGEKKWAEALALRASGAGTTGSPLNADGTPRSHADQLFSLADLALGVGQTERATKLTDIAGKTLARETRAAASVESAKLTQLRARDRDLNLLASTLQSSTDQPSWEQANMLYSSITGKPSPWMGVPYSPDLVKQLQLATVSAKDKLKLDMDEVEQNSRDRYRNARIGLGAQANAIRARLADLAEGREERLAKAGGKPVGSPSQGDVREAIALMKEQFPDLKTDDAGGLRAARAVASRAKEIAREIPGLGMSGAMRRAMTEMRDDFITDQTMIAGFGVPGTRSTKFVGGGRSAADAMELPVGTGGGIDAAKMVVGRYYATPRGVVRYAGDGKVVPVAAPSAGRGPGVAAVDGGEDLDEEETD